MANRVSSFSHLVQRVTASCLLHPLVVDAADHHDFSVVTHAGEESDGDSYYFNCGKDESEDGEEEDVEVPGRDKEVLAEMETILAEVFEAAANLKRAYVSLQEAHSPWDPDKMRVADVAVVSELRRIGVLKERYRRSAGGGRRRVGAATLREVVAPYEAVVEDLKRELKSKEAEIEILKEKLQTTSSPCSSAKKGKAKQKAKNCSSQSQAAMPPAPELFESTMSLVKGASKSFTALLLSLMRSAHWDIAAAVRSIEAASSAAVATAGAIIGTNRARYALESYVNRKMFQGFEHETFYMDGGLCSVADPEQHRRGCYRQYRDMKAMDPAELLGILPNCSFGNFCFKKYLAIIHPKMEESLFGDLEQRRQVLAGNHPRSQFYGEFLELAKAVWMLHLLAFSVEPPRPCQFEASEGSEFRPEYMESVGKYSGGGGFCMGLVVGFPVSPGFKLANGSVVKASVFMVPKCG
ncbi:unnamed protein product [Cuscuta campestris]|uniref:Uncharacterized protein n=1 Tax=Cuscuta campestris TaxID=132261 RepID=A0A484LJS8_9ASTE|nr:unnamed protein product [Cuscuta campestris]